jgi:hypothetical protein
MESNDLPDKQAVPPDARPPATPDAQAPQATPGAPPPARSPLGDYVRDLQQEFEEQEEKSTLRP